MASGGNRVYTGSFKGTGASKDIAEIGFAPVLVKLYNTDGNCQAVWTADMGAGVMQKTVDSGSGTTDISKITGGNGVTVLGQKGFTIGADGDLNVAGEEVFFEAWG